MKTLASRLRNVVEIYRRDIVNGRFGDTTEERFFAKRHADIIPLRQRRSDPGEIVDAAKQRFKLLMRNGDVRKSDYIRYNGLHLEVDYVLASYDAKGYMEVYATMVEE